MDKTEHPPIVTISDELLILGLLRRTLSLLLLAEDDLSVYNVDSVLSRFLDILNVERCAWYRASFPDDLNSATARAGKSPTSKPNARINSSKLGSELGNTYTSFFKNGEGSEFVNRTMDILRFVEDDLPFLDSHLFWVAPIEDVFVAARDDTLTAKPGCLRRQLRPQYPR